jgi:hypothetical protein
MDEYKLASRYIAERFATEPPSDAAFWPVSSVPVIQQFGSDRSESRHSRSVKNDLSLPFCMFIFGGAQDKILSVKQGRINPRGRHPCICRAVSS